MGSGSDKSSIIEVLQSHVNGIKWVLKPYLHQYLAIHFGKNPCLSGLILYRMLRKCYTKKLYDDIFLFCCASQLYYNMNLEDCEMITEVRSGRK